MACGAARETTTGGLPLLLPHEAAASGGYARHAAPRLPHGGDKREHTWQRVDSLGVQHLAHRPDAEWAAPPTIGEQRLVDSLSSAIERRVRHSTDPTKLGTVMSFVERFGRTVPHRPLWRKRSHGAADWAAVAHNARTIELVGEFMRRTGSIRPGQVGKALPADTISEYLGVLRVAMESQFGAPLTNGDEAVRRKRLQKDWKLEDGPLATVRRIRRLGFCAQHFKRLLVSSFDRRSELGAFRYMLSLLMYYCQMRAGEAGRGKGTKPFDTQRGARLCDVIWWSADITPDNLPAVVFMLCSSKPPHVRYPCEISEMSSETAAATARELCGYATFVPYWQRRARAVCTRPTVCTATEMGGSFCDACRAAPLFQSPDGMVPTTAYCMDIARDMCVAIGEPAAEYTGYSWHIGRATDTVRRWGHEKAKAVTKRRGRYNSDIYHIYQRSDVSDQLEDSARIMEADGQTIEGLLPEWVQPARRWTR